MRTQIRPSRGRTRSTIELVNIAEERERIRALRDGEQEGTLEDSVSAAVESLAEEGVDAAVFRAVLDDVDVIPTFTAHPTEARRKTVKGILRRVQEDLCDIDKQCLTDAEWAPTRRASTH